MASIFEPCLESTLYIADGTKPGFSRPGLVSSRVFTGNRQSRDFSTGQRRIGSISFDEFPASGDKLPRYEAFLDVTRMAHLPFWIKWPVSRFYKNAPAGPPTDGTRVAFPNPLPNASDLSVRVGEWISNPANFDTFTTANLLTDNQAAAIDADATEMDFEGTGGSVAYNGGDSKFGTGCWMYSNTNTGDHHAIILDSSYRAAVTASEYYKLIAWVKDAADFELQARWYNGASPNGSSTSMTPVTCTITGWTLLEYDVQAPASTTHCELAVVRHTSTSGRFYADCLGIIPGQLDRWYLPSVAPGVIRFASAPASGSRLFVSGTDYLRSRMQMTRSSTSHKLTLTGHAVADVLDVEEAWEE